MEETRKSDSSSSMWQSIGFQLNDSLGLNLFSCSLTSSTTDWNEAIFRLNVPSTPFAMSQHFERTGTLAVSSELQLSDGFAVSHPIDGSTSHAESSRFAMSGSIDESHSLVPSNSVMDSTKQWGTPLLEMSWWSESSNIVVSLVGFWVNGSRQSVTWFWHNTSTGCIKHVRVDGFAWTHKLLCRLEKPSCERVIWVLIMIGIEQLCDNCDIDDLFKIRCFRAVRLNRPIYRLISGSWISKCDRSRSARIEGSLKFAISEGLGRIARLSVSVGWDEK
jgi:hypothetical protein